MDNQVNLSLPAWVLNEICRLADQENISLEDAYTCMIYGGLDVDTMWAIEAALAEKVWSTVH